MSRNQPPRRRYAPYGQWAAQATRVALLVGQGWGVSDAVRSVVRKQRYPDPDLAFRGIRAAYYEMRTKERAEAAGKKKEEFEI